MNLFVSKIILSAVVVKDGKALILLRSKDDDIFPGLWEIPGGKKELGEDWEVSLKREIKEETDLIVKPIAPVNVFGYQIEKEDEIRDAIQINFLVEIESGEVKISNEHEDYAWVEEKQLNNYNMSSSTKKAIKAGLSFAKKET